MPISFIFSVWCSMGHILLLFLMSLIQSIMKLKRNWTILNYSNRKQIESFCKEFVLENMMSKAIRTAERKEKKKNQIISTTK
jgi:hypothetical protein